MKKFLIALIAISLSAATFAQAPVSYKKRPSLGLNFFLKDMYTADLIDHTSLSNVLAKNQWTKVKDMSPGLSLKYYEGITEYIDFVGSLGGSYVKYPFAYTSGVTASKDNRFLLETSASINVKLLRDKYFMVPYFNIGVGASMYGGTYFAAYIPSGMGLQFNLGEGTFVHTFYGFNIKGSNLSLNHFDYSIGISSPLHEKKAETVLVAPPPPPVEKDTDGDGIVDSKDKCPTVPGLAKYDGCPVPDTDGDGINDENDKCVTVKGVAKYDGCPVPDRDKDGINDDEDKCPDVPGVARYQGCPIPDRDGDGINDEEDRCPDVPGIKEEFGCPDLTPILRDAAKSIYFVTGTAKFAFPDQAPGKLKAALDLMNKYPNLHIDIEGHTDNTGTDKINIPLGTHRAETIQKYFLDNGIAQSRLTAKGYGSTRPVDSNKTAKGRQNNRRTELVPKFVNK